MVEGQGRVGPRSQRATIPSEMWRLYLETSVVSYLTARPSLHLIRPRGS
jgi:hypothetical protein